MIYPSFNLAISALTDRMRGLSKAVRTERWQSIDISKRPEAEMRELLNQYFQVPMESEELDFYRSAIGPNTPWADRHFELERVSGEPINPGTTWKEWPWGHSADKFRTMRIHRPIPSHDWAYLAGLIDGDGSVGHGGARGLDSSFRIKITQVAGDYLRSIFERFEVGNFGEGHRHNPLSDNIQYIWRITKREEVRWVLENCLPYLKLKRPNAEDVLRRLPEFDRRYESLESALEFVPFSHSYAERYFPKFAGMTRGGLNLTPELTPNSGIRFQYGDLLDVINLLVREPMTRQAYLPVFFPEDTGVVHGERVPCSLGYHFIQRSGFFHVFYPIRSCDFVRHFRDDVYLTVRLLLWILERCRQKNPAVWNQVHPGMYSMWIGSLHCFVNDHRGL